MRAESPGRRRVSILGATGSIGRSTLAVLEDAAAAGWRIEVEALTAASNVAALTDAAKATDARFIAVADASLLADTRDAARAAGLDCEVGAGPSAILEAADRDADWVMSAMVGAAALEPTLAAARRGATIALANKECVVCGGGLLKATAAAGGARILPVDSEHNAVFQVLTHRERVERVTLTASGGPFRTWTRQEISAATPEQALKHPNWSMGAKITIDSATLMNKGLELIEAAILFDLADDQLDVVVHPQSIVHSTVAYVDGSVLAQLSEPDMRTPIAFCLAWPDRAPVGVKRLDLARIGALTFEAPDLARFPALGLAREALRAGGAAPVVLNAANEVAVAAFLDRRIGFLDIPAVVESALEAAERAGLLGAANSPSSFDAIEKLDQWARAAARRASAPAKVS